MVNVLIISILIIPWLILPFNHIPDCTRLIKAVFFDLTMFGVIVMALKNGLKFQYQNKYIAYLSAWIFFTFIWNWYIPILKSESYNIGMSDSMIHSILAIVATILVCSNLGRVDFVRCAKAMCISSTLVSIFCIFQGIGLDPMKHIAKYGLKDSRHIAALLDNPDLVGNYLCMTLPLFLYFNKPKYYLCFGICVVSLFLSQSSLSIVASVIGLFVYLIFRFSRIKVAVIGLLSIQVLFVVFCVFNHSFNKTGNGFTGRVTAWHMMVDRTNNPLFGQGLGVVKSLGVTTSQMPAKLDPSGIHANFWMYAHNDYLEIWISLGALGLFLLILVIVDVFRKFNYKLDNQIGFAYYGCFISFLIVMFGSFPMEFPPLALNGLIFYWAMQRT